MTRPTELICQECGRTFSPRSNRGRLPSRCYDCRDERQRRALEDRLSALRGQNRPGYVVSEPVPEPLRTKVETDPTWLDSPDIQAQLAERNETSISEPDSADVPPSTGADGSEMEASVPRGTPEQELHQRLLPEVIAAQLRDAGVPEERVAAAEDRVHELLDAAGITPVVCRIPHCQMPDPPHVGPFCTNHWQRIPLEVRQVLLGVPEGSGPFDRAVRQAIRQFTP